MITRGITIVAVFGVLTWLERRRPLRAPVESTGLRVSRNLAMAALAALTVQAIEVPLVRPLAVLVEQRRWGITQAVAAPPWIAAALALLLLDYTLYVWHVLTHRVPWLWRLHVVHHIDRDLDASTALRFHAAELAASVPWRAAQVLVIGVSPHVLALWQTCVLASILFHHANVRLPAALEHVLNLVLVTPRMHGIHHSAVREHTDSNWSSGLAIWDRLHGTFRADVPQDAITIGVPAYPRANDVTLTNVLALPFVRQRPSWQRPA
ncbi:MAG: sterol desaturase family protein [Deltaproteobacteria bacterium]|nr:sterol desaturase family protein [Deltaproteobacteria bacterium]